MSQAQPQTLPAGWAAYRTDDGRVYYHCAASGVSQWVPPTPPARAPSPPPPSSATLPFGWLAHRDDQSGMVFYHHYASDSVQWQRPPPPAEWCVSLLAPPPRSLPRALHSPSFLGSVFLCLFVCSFSALSLSIFLRSLPLVVLCSLVLLSASLSTFTDRHARA